MKSWHSKTVPDLIFFYNHKSNIPASSEIFKLGGQFTSENIWNTEGEIRRKSWLTSIFFFRPTKKMHFFKFLRLKKQGLDVSTYAPRGG